MIWTVIKAWIVGNLRTLEYAVMGSIIALAFYFGYHVHSIIDEAKETKVVQKQLETAHESQIIRDHIASTPDGDSIVLLHSKWTR